MRQALSYEVCRGYRMDLFSMLVLTTLKLYLGIGACRIISMTFKTFSRSVTIKNRKLAGMLIAYKNTWGIATSAEKRNRMSLPGVFSYVIFLPQIAFLGYDWWCFMITGAATQCPAEETYLAVAVWYYMIAMCRKIKEADRFRKGDYL